MAIPDVIERRKARTLRRRRARRTKARNKLRKMRQGSFTAPKTKKKKTAKKKVKAGGPAREGSKALARNRRRKKAGSGGPAREGSKALARNKRRKRRAKKSLARSTKRRQQRHNATRRALKKKKKGKKKTARRVSSTGSSRSSGRSTSKGRRPRLTKAQAKRSRAKARNVKRRVTKKKKKKGGAKLPKYPGQLTARGRSASLHAAKLTAKEQFLPGIQEIRRQLKAIERARSRDVRTQEVFGQKGDERLAGAGEWLRGVLSDQAGVTQGIYGAAKENISNVYAGAQGQQQKASDKILSQMRGQATALGLSDALDTPEQELKAQMLAAQAETEGDFASSMANIETLGASEAARSQDIVGTAARQNVQDRGDLQATVAGEIGAANRAASEQTAEGYGGLRDIEAQRGLAVRNLYRQEKLDRQDRRRQAWMDKLYGKVQLNTMRLQNAQLNLEKQASRFNRSQQRQATKLTKQKFSFDKSMAKRQLRNQEARLRAKIAAANSPEAKLSARLELEKVRADINYINARSAAALAKASTFRSRSARRKRKLWRSPLPGPGERPGGR